VLGTPIMTTQFATDAPRRGERVLFVTHLVMRFGRIRVRAGPGRRTEFPLRSERLSFDSLGWVQAAGTGR
jgi:hypothetical protein